MSHSNSYLVIVYTSQESMAQAAQGLYYVVLIMLN